VARSAKQMERQAALEARVLVDTARNVAFIRLKDPNSFECTFQAKAGTEIFDRAHRVVDDINRRLASMARRTKR
jgi:hypothetical protein